MIISALLSFLGGNVFRMLWGELSSYLNKRQDNTHELQLLRVQGELDSAAHTRNIEAMTVQANLNVQIVREQSTAKVSEIESDAWLEAVKGTTKSIGIWFIDAWNGAIRPLVATWALWMISVDFYSKGWVLDENGWMICSAALGIYLADRSLFKRGK
jgi:hypothetical protein